ncbi:MAG: hypothetical protein J0L73_28565 [Verrucomicrobia bacterium]|nr:hypothetical protein [Verrucomicrobiota bacterium]
MGLKSLKEHFRIGHIIARYADKGVCIGSSYVHNLIHVSETGEVKWSSELGKSGNEDLCRYMQDMSADPDTVARLLAEPDEFSASLPVYTFKDGQVVEELCEKRGWPNLTHAGELMYDNSHFSTPEEAATHAKRELFSGIRIITEQVVDLDAKLKERRELIHTMTEQLTNLVLLYPASASQQPQEATGTAA